MNCEYCGRPTPSDSKNKREKSGFLFCSTNCLARWERNKPVFKSPVYQAIWKEGGDEQAKKTPQPP